MENGKIHNTSSQDSIQQELNKLNAILSERLTFDPFSVDDKTLWNIVSKRENTTIHPYHFMIVRFGEVYEASTSYNQKYFRIPIYYADKCGSKNLSDFGFALSKPNSNRKQFNILIDPYYYQNNSKELKINEIRNILPNHTFFLAQSIKGKNRFNQDKFAWILVKLEESLSENSKIIREYTLKVQIWAYRHLRDVPSNFGLNIPRTTLLRILDKKIDDNVRLLENNKDKFVQKIDTPEEDDWQDPDDSAYERDLQDELDYIRQNGGDWIDD